MFKGKLNAIILFKEYSNKIIPNGIYYVPCIDQHIIQPSS